MVYQIVMLQISALKKDLASSLSVLLNVFHPPFLLSKKFLGPLQNPVSPLPVWYTVKNQTNFSNTNREYSMA